MEGEGFSSHCQPLSAWKTLASVIHDTTLPLQVPIVPLKYIEHGVYGDLIIIYPKLYIYLRGTIFFCLTSLGPEKVPIHILSCLSFCSSDT